ncbi:hypothetical protein MSG28_013130 [Choristoneura fumiferana]|uniref:Uncharacterized protein n=1 Tax=Choristoneura fumiferana TaxID=7141 RepID=A0ACC0KS51_CHOFU|nr:hypothetical protein MSG28_013130 [Choristoneura fumiferana]
MPQNEKPQTEAVCFKSRQLGRGCSNVYAAFDNMIIDEAIDPGKEIILIYWRNLRKNMKIQ